MPSIVVQAQGRSQYQLIREEESKESLASSLQPR